LREWRGVKTPDLPARVRVVPPTRGEAVHRLAAESMSPDASPKIENGGGVFATAADLAAECGVSLDAMDAALRRWAEKHPECRETLEKPRPREPHYVYRRKDVEPVLKKYRERQGVDGRRANRRTKK